MVRIVFALLSRVLANSVRRYTGTRAACQSWQWMISGIQSM